jgi:hypothetical protein
MARTLIAIYSDGPTLTAASAASCLPTYALTTIQPGYWQVGKMWRITAGGRVSTVVTTPGTFRLDLRFGSVTVFDTLAMAGNIVVQSNIPWWGEIILTCRAAGSGTTAQLFSQGFFSSLAWLNVAAPATGPWAGGTPVPYNTNPALGTGFDSTVANALDFRFTQTAATGSFNLCTFVVEELV